MPPHGPSVYDLERWCMARRAEGMCIGWTSSPAWLWGNPLHADVTLQLCTTQPAAAAPSNGEVASYSDGGQGTTKAARSASSVSAPAAARAADRDPPATTHARTYLLHASVLASGSPYFKKRTTPCDGGGAATLRYADAPAAAEGAGGVSSSAPLLLVEHMEEGELDAMEAVLRHCYTAQLCDEGGSAAQLGFAALLQMVVLADRFDVPQCVRHCQEELVTRGAAAYDISTVNAVLGGLSPGVLGLPSHAAVVRTATTRLLHLLGDAEAVGDAWYDPASDLDAKLLQLSHPALLILLSHDELMARSENSVLMMADAWVCNSPAGAACSEAQLRQVAEAVRLGLLTYTFAVDVLPALPWLQLTAAEADSLTRWFAARRERRDSLLKNDRLAGPEAWYSTLRDSAPGGHAKVHHWDVARADLEALLGQAAAHPQPLVNSPTSTLWSRKLFISGFTTQLSLSIVSGSETGCCVTVEAHVCRVLGRAAAEGGQGAGERVAVEAWLDEGFQGKPFSAVCVPYENMSMLLLLSCAGREGADVREWRCEEILDGRGVTQEYFLSVPRERLLQIGAWEPYLVDGRVQLKGTILHCR